MVKSLQNMIYRRTCRLGRRTYITIYILVLDAFAALTLTCIVVWHRHSNIMIIHYTQYTLIQTICALAYHACRHNCIVHMQLDMSTSKVPIHTALEQRAFMILRTTPPWLSLFWQGSCTDTNLLTSVVYDATVFSFRRTSVNNYD